jgi:hypothetical protein
MVNKANKASNVTVVHIAVPSTLHMQVRMAALAAGLTLKDAVIAAMGEWVAPSKPRHIQPVPAPVDLAQVRAQAGKAALGALIKALEDGMSGTEAKAYVEAGLDNGKIFVTLT